ncbi:MAG: EthD family reductase [Anaerolineales bacterium]|nr:EthD family reductase [Anaerolineales bacterium]
MHKLMLLFRQPDNVVEFETRWSQDFVRTAERMPGLRRVAISRITGGPSGEVDLHLVHEFYFDDAQAMRDAMASQEGQAAGVALMSFAADEVTLCFAEHLEDDLKR